MAEALRQAARRLEITSDTARLDAELLMAHALDVTRSELLLRRMSDGVPPGFAGLVDRRARHEPVAYITGRQEFYGFDLEVNPSVLIPRSDSETLIEAAREAFAGRSPPRRILDLGTGSGALLLAALTIWPGAEGIGVDRDLAALSTATRNAERVGVNVTSDPAVEPRIRALFRCLDWTENNWRDDLGRFDLILANPPYVEGEAPLAQSVREWEPAGALFAGPEGLDDYRRLIPQLAHLLQPKGFAVLEIGATQAEAVSELARTADFHTRIVPDLGGRPRAVVLAIRGWQTNTE